MFRIDDCPLCNEDLQYSIQYACCDQCCDTKTFPANCKKCNFEINEVNYRRYFFTYKGFIFKIDIVNKNIQISENDNLLLTVSSEEEKNIYKIFDKLIENMEFA